MARGEGRRGRGANLIVFVSKGGTRGTRLLCDCSVRGGQPLLVEESDEGEAAGASREQGTGDRGQGTTGEETAQKQVHTIS